MITTALSVLRIVARFPRSPPGTLDIMVLYDALMTVPVAAMRHSFPLSYRKWQYHTLVRFSYRISYSTLRLRVGAAAMSKLVGEPL